jgi:glycosyltransferase involved in cell wall biosynthesis
MARARTSVELADRLLALSEFARDTYVSFGVPIDRTFVVPLGVALERFPVSPPPRTGPLTYLFVAHVTQTTGILKGLQYLLRAWAQLSLAEARLVICGKVGPEVQEVIKSCNGDLRNVEFLGGVKDPAPYYRAAGVFVLPSLAEGMAKVTLEAMATGRAVVATPNSGTVARAGADGLLVPARDVNALADAMLTFYRDRDLAERMGESAAAHARGFPWERFSVQVANIVEHVWRGHALN